MMDLIENGIIGRLGDASQAGVLGYHYKTLETYPLDWDSYILEKGAGLPAPAAWATFAGWRRKDSEDAASARLIATFGLVVLAENLRDETATRHGGPNPASEPGSYRLAVDAAQLLHGQDFGLPIESLEIGPLRFVQRLPAWEKRKVSMLSLELITGFGLQASNFGTGEEDDFAPFLAFHANWDIPAFGNVDADAVEPGPQIPADDTADATDHVELESEP